MLQQICLSASCFGGSMRCTTCAKSMLSIALQMRGHKLLWGGMPSMTSRVGRIGAHLPEGLTRPSSILTLCCSTQTYITVPRHGSCCRGTLLCSGRDNQIWTCLAGVVKQQASSTCMAITDVHWLCSSLSTASRELHIQAVCPDALFQRSLSHRLGLCQARQSGWQPASTGGPMVLSVLIG